MHYSKISKEDRQEIKRLYTQEHWKIADLAKKYHIHRKSIHYHLTHEPQMHSVVMPSPHTPFEKVVPKLYLKRLSDAMQLKFTRDEKGNLIKVEKASQAPTRAEIKKKLGYMPDNDHSMQ